MNLKRINSASMNVSLRTDVFMALRSQSSADAKHYANEFPDLHALKPGEYFRAEHKAEMLIWKPQLCVETFGCRA